MRKGGGSPADGGGSELSQSETIGASDQLWRKHRKGGSMFNPNLAEKKPHQNPRRKRFLASCVSVRRLLLLDLSSGNRGRHNKTTQGKVSGDRKKKKGPLGPYDDALIWKVTKLPGRI